MDKNPSDEKQISARVQALVIEGNRLMEAGNGEGGKECFRKALALIRDFGQVLADRASQRQKDGALEDAQKYSLWAASLLNNNFALPVAPNPKSEKHWRFTEKEAACLQAVRRAPDSPGAWTNLGVVLARMKREDEAERCYRTAIGLDKDHSGAYFNLSYILLRRGSFEEGWRCLERRKSHGYLDNFFTFPRWNGEPLHGKSLIIGFEGGHGDMIQFCRYASILKTMGAAKISITCHPGLKTLFSTLPGVDEVLSFPEETDASGWDFWTLPLSLPYHCKTRLENIPAPIPYLSADPARVDKWSQLLPLSGIRIGLVWKGNPRFENDLERSLPSLDVLAPLGAVEGARFVSLQKGEGENSARLPPSGFHLVALGESFCDFADTAAVLSCLDLLISVDTGVAHLAGAMGKPCWLLLPDHLCDWRWLSGRTDSPWYPKGMRLFRQPPGGGWSQVIDEVVVSLVRFKKEWKDGNRPAW
ncbi:MAG: tetratricopeptide repeat-containing glycosyltransferase family protein [Syntrophobacteraceae bacterium]|nr:tetratricopeptide repeat-containing glycosyltransferase family protein [Syntrophobacteraceae bacterium]